MYHRTLSHSVNQLRQQRSAFIARAQAILPRDRNQGITERDSAEFDALMRQVDALQDQINSMQLGDGYEKALRAFGATNAGVSSSHEEPGARAFHNFLKFGINGLSADERDQVNRRASLIDDTAMFQAAQSVSTGSGGGYAVPDAAMAPLVEALKLSGGILGNSTIIQSETGADLPIPTDNETAAMGEIVPENSQHNEGDLALGQVVLQSFLYSSKIVRVSIQLMDDAGFNFGEFVLRKLGERLGRVTASHWATGDGSSKPRGLVTAAGVGVTAASATAVTYDELVNLLHSVDPLYRAGGSWVMNDTTFSAIRKLKDSQNRPLYGDLGVNAPTSLLGKPVVIDPGVPAMATGNKAIIFGNLKSYYIRLVKAPRVLRLEERYADYGQLGFLSFLRADGDLIDGGGGAVKALQMA